MNTLWLRNSLASIRLLLVLTVVLGIGYPLAVTAIAQLPGLKKAADGSIVQVNGKAIGSGIIAQPFTDTDGNPLRQYFQERPSDAGTGYDLAATSASNLGPESIVDTLPNPADTSDTGKQSLLTQVCERSVAVGRLEGVSGARPFCTPDGVGAVLAVFWSGPGYVGQITRVVSVNQATGAPFLAKYHDVVVEPGKYGADYSSAQIVPIRGDAPANPAVPADAVTASASGLDPHISTAYAQLQIARVAHARGVSPRQVRVLVDKFTDGRGLGFIGAPRVNVLKLNIALDATYPAH